MTKCEHLEFRLELAVNKLEDTGAFMADIKIQCSSCQWPFIFPGIPAGLDSQHLTVSLDSQELHIPIQPKGSAVFPNFPSFGVKLH